MEFRAKTRGKGNDSKRRGRKRRKEARSEKSRKRGKREEAKAEEGQKIREERGRSLRCHAGISLKETLKPEFPFIF